MGAHDARARTPAAHTITYTCAPCYRAAEAHSHIALSSLPLSLFLFLHLAKENTPPTRCVYTLVARKGLEDRACTTWRFNWRTRTKNCEFTGFQLLSFRHSGVLRFSLSLGHINRTKFCMLYNYDDNNC